MSKRSEKEARNNDDLVSQFFPVLAVTALLSYFQYRKLKKQYLANPQAKRIECIYLLKSGTAAKMPAEME